MTKEEFEKLKADEMRAYLAERGIKVAAKATKAMMVEALVASTTSSGQVEAPTVVLAEEVPKVKPVTAFGPLNVADAIVVTEAAAVQNDTQTIYEPQPPPDDVLRPRAPLNRKQRRRLAALTEKRADRKMRALDLRG